MTRLCKEHLFLHQILYERKTSWIFSFTVTASLEQIDFLLCLNSRLAERSWWGFQIIYSKLTSRTATKTIIVKKGWLFVFCFFCLFHWPYFIVFLHWAAELSGRDSGERWTMFPLFFISTCFQICIFRWHQSSNAGVYFIVLTNCYSEWSVLIS